ncbi:MAG: SLC13 family permease [Planctomycetaceae bacterium]
MTLAGISIAALVVVVAVSCATNANVGLLAIALTWILGGWVAPWLGHEAFAAKAMAGWFPADLFLTLAGVTLLFAIAAGNGTLGLVTRAAERLCRSRPALLPPAFFLLATAVSAAGAGNVPTAALLAAPAMAAAGRSGLSPLLMMVMVGHGAIAGTLSPVSPMGVIADEKLAAMGLAGHAGYTFGMNALVNALVAGGAWLALNRWRSGSPVTAVAHAAVADHPETTSSRVATHHVATLLAIGGVVVGTVFLGMHVGFAAFTAATLLLLGGAGEERAALRTMPWGVILMVCGVSMLVALCEQTGGLDIFSRWIAACATPRSLPAWLAGLTGLVSVFSSTSGVVLPTFLPVVPDVLGHMGGTADPDRMLAAATAVNVGSNIVDVSSVSTIGALCVAACPDEATRRVLYRQGLAWGLAMTIVGAAMCQVVL